MSVTFEHRKSIPSAAENAMKYGIDEDTLRRMAQL